MKISQIYSESEAKRLWSQDQILYAEIASQYPCQELPTDIKCVFCEEARNREWECPKLIKLNYYKE